MSAVLKAAVMGERASAILARAVVVAIFFAAALAVQALVPISMAMGDGKMMRHKGGGGGRVCCDECSCDQSNPKKCQCKDRMENKCQPWCNACGCVAYSETGVQQPLCTCFDLFQDHCGKRCNLPIPPSYN